MRCTLSCEWSQVSLILCQRRPGNIYSSCWRSFFLPLHPLEKPSCILLYHCNSSVVTILHFPKKSLPKTFSDSSLFPHPFFNSMTINLSRQRRKSSLRQTWMDFLTLRPSSQSQRLYTLRVPRNNELQKYRLNGKEEEVAEQYPKQTQHREPVVISLIPAYHPASLDIIKVSQTLTNGPLAHNFPLASRKRWQREKQQVPVDRSCDAFSAGWRKGGKPRVV